MSARWRALAGVTVVLTAITPAAADEGFDVTATYRVPLDDAPTRGPRDALVTIVEFSDFNCQYCRLANDTINEVLRLYPRDVRVVYRHSLLDPEDGTLAGEAALAAAAQGRFWPMHDALFASGGGLDREGIERAGRDAGLDLARLRRDLDDARHRSAIREQDRAASDLGISATPVFFVNGRPLLGAHGLGSFVRTIEEELARSRGLVARGVAPRDVYHRVTARGLPRAQAIPDGADLAPPLLLDLDRVHAVGLGDPSHRRGREDALVTMVEFGDFYCGYCVRVRPVVAQLMAHYGDELRVVFRHMPLGNNPESRLVAEAAMAAGEQGHFWELHDRVFAGEGPLVRPELEALAKDIGLDMDRFRRALDRRSFARAVSQDAADAARLGVRGTPTFFINGVPLVGSQPIEDFRAIIDQEMARARALLAQGVPRARIYRAATGAPASPPE